MNTNSSQELIAKYRNYEGFAELTLDNYNQLSGPEGNLIHLIAEIGTVEELDLLVAAGADINARNKTDYTPLHCAARTGRFDMAEKLLALGANPNKRGKYYDTPEEVARENDHPALADLFIPIDTPLQNLITKYRDHMDFAELDMRDINQQSYPDDDALIHLVTRVGTLDEIELLIASGAKVNAIGDMGYTPLHYATLAGRLDVAEWLLMHGADPSIKCEHGYTAEAVARSIGYEDVVDLIHRARAAAY